MTRRSGFVDEGMIFAGGMFDSTMDVTTLKGVFETGGAAVAALGVDVVNHMTLTKSREVFVAIPCGSGGFVIRIGIP